MSDLPGAIALLVIGLAGLIWWWWSSDRHDPP